ncbi:MAG: class I lanthipeptide [Taibaiella sp.]|jgi:hypothetical protein
MKKKIELKKLILKKETIVPLTKSQIESIKGGDSVLDPIKHGGTSLAVNNMCTGR